jgi:hypothetical protein
MTDLYDQDADVTEFEPEPGGLFDVPRHAPFDWIETHLAPILAVAFLVIVVVVGGFVTSSIARHHRQSDVDQEACAVYEAMWHEKGPDC